MNIPLPKIETPRAVTEQDQRITRAAMCNYCAGAVARKCPYSGASIDRHIVGAKDCPRDMHPDEKGRVLWPLGLVAWYGVPAPIRWRKSYRVVLPGCGCIVVLRDSWQWIKAAVRAVAGRWHLWRLCRWARQAGRELRSRND